MFRSKNGARSRQRSLTEFQATVWHSVVATKPPDWFRQDTRELLLLVGYCRHVSTAAVLTTLIDTFNEAALKDVENFKQFDGICKVRDREVRAPWPWPGRCGSRSSRATAPKQPLGSPIRYPGSGLRGNADLLQWRCHRDSESRLLRKAEGKRFRVRIGSLREAGTQATE